MRVEGSPDDKQEGVRMQLHDNGKDHAVCLFDSSIDRESLIIWI